MILKMEKKLINEIRLNITARTLTSNILLTFIQNTISIIRQLIDLYQ